MFNKREKIHREGLYGQIRENLSLLVNNEVKRIDNDQ
jgi:hypothetical protein